MRLIPIALILLLAGCFPHNVKDPAVYSVSQIVEIPDTKKAFIYGKVEEWFAINFYSGSDVVQVKNSQTGTIIGRGSSDVVMDFVTRPYSFLLKVETKDNKIRFTAQDFYWVDPRTPISRQSALVSIESQMKSTAESLSEFIKTEAIASDW